MTKKKTEKIGTIHLRDIKVWKKAARTTQVQKTSKDYDRNRIKEETRKEIVDE